MNPHPWLQGLNVTFWGGQAPPQTMLIEFQGFRVVGFFFPYPLFQIHPLNKNKNKTFQAEASFRAVRLFSNHRYPPNREQKRKKQAGENH